ncbi:MAG: TnpV protein [Clostridia bacterium]|nr:TnpV protein [Clostridia bacterium]MBQ5318110.1 TnpV protein [Oscillospiraceae bacterium]
MKEKFIKNGIEYVRNGDYYIPNLTVPDDKVYNIGRYGRMHSIFIKENRPAFYSMKMLNGTWLAYLEEIDTSAKEMIDKLIKDMAIKQGVTEELKAKDQMAWLGAMNNIRHSAEEFVLRDFVYSMEVRR